MPEKSSEETRSVMMKRLTKTKSIGERARRGEGGRVQGSGKLPQVHWRDQAESS
jgi:hypothetical protein